MFTAKSMRMITNRAIQKERKEYDKLVKDAIKESAKNKMFSVPFDTDLTSPTFVSKLTNKGFKVEQKGCIHKIYW